ncbi:hypothetical protein HII31_13319 [Pseudocercospora fuligena]|uniref:Uncharacterized protein n=1 Tax=Pseudocercospora fuligena TaxID=685502 RepID=A0A8H6R4Y9_9PEZI|nr:hypothetical protein HII31_13319 [Pseudocercospora fuligena]
MHYNTGDLRRLRTDPVTYWYIHVPHSGRDVKADLDTWGRDHLQSHNKEKLWDIHCRRQRGLLNYSKYDVEELRGFCTNRGLKLPKAGKNKRQNKNLLIKHLDAADDDATFDKFLDLPPELRVIMFEWHFRDIAPSDRENYYLAETIIRAQPPIARTSPLIRKEALDVWYKMVTYKFYPRSGFYEAEFDFFLSPRTFLKRIKNLEIILRSMVEVGQEDAASYFDGEIHWKLSVVDGKARLALHEEGSLRPLAGTFDEVVKNHVEAVARWRWWNFMERRGIDENDFDIKSLPINDLPHLLAKNH